MSEDRDRRSGDPEDGGSLNLFSGSDSQPEAGAAARKPPKRPQRRRGAPADQPAPAQPDGEDAAEAGGPEPKEEADAERPARKGGGGKAGVGQIVPGKRRRKKENSALPALRPADAKAPAVRAERVEAIRRDLVKRRRKRGLGVLARLAIFVWAPTMIVAWFLWTKASDLYQTESVFVIQNAEIGGGSSNRGGLFAAFGGGSTDGIAVQNFILSRDVLRRLDTQFGLIDSFKDPELDWLHRLHTEASFEKAYEHYQRFVEVRFDPTEGVLTLSVVAAEPEYAQSISLAILGYAEEMVDGLSDKLRANALSDADTNLADAEERLRNAQLEAAEIRKQLETFSVEGEFSAELGIITGMETELEALRARLAGLRRVTEDDDPRIQRLIDQVEILETQIAARREGVTGSGEGRRSLADINAALERANFEVTAAMAIFTAAIEAREVARREADRQHRYLSLVVPPTAPDQANYPKKFRMTGVAFLVCLGIYIIGSLTISLIREQASI